MITIQPIREAHAARPFRPFSLLTADGEHYAVRHPEVMAQLDTGRAVVVATPSGGFACVDLLMITAMTFEPDGDAEGGSSNRNGSRLDD